MKKIGMLEALEEVATQFSIRVIYDQFFGQGGFCRLKDRPFIILNRTLSNETKISLFVEGLKHFPLDNVALPAKIRDLLKGGSP